MADERPAPEPAIEETNEASSATEAGSVAAKLKQLEEEKKQLTDQLVRRQADFENFRKRLEREQAEFRQQAEADLVESLLPVLDALERAVAAPANSDGSGGNEEYRKGVELIYKQLADLLGRAGLKPIEALGQAFDPFYHHAVERVETTQEEDQTVLGELQRGYLFKQRLLRPALVRVAVRPRRGEENSGSDPVN